MCGIAGYARGREGEEVATLAALLAGVRARGPDDEGAALIARSSGRIVPVTTTKSRPALRERLSSLEAPGQPHDLALAHARYAIIDTSDAAHQPFMSRFGDLAGVLNGEIYNHVELRRMLEGDGIPMRTASDTEVLVEGYRCWGDALWPRLNGFWAVVLFDARDGSVTFSRDRMGVAPLYYRETTEGLFFASRISPLLAVPPATRENDVEAVRGFVLTGIKDCGPATCFRAVQSFPPASVVRLPRGAASLRQAHVQRFWQLPARRWTTRDLSLDEAARGLRERLVRAVELRLRADRPVAFELSGGLDSSSLAAAAQLLGRRVSTYTVSVPERDELPFARAVAQRLDFPQQVLTGDESGLVAALPTFGRIMEEPYHSPNVFTSFRMRQRIKGDGFAVVVSGAGGDELLGGYEYEFWDAARRDLWQLGARAHVIRHALAHHAGSWRRLRHSARDAIGAAKRWLPHAAESHAARLARSTPGPTVAEQLQEGYRGRSFHDRVRFHFEVAHLPYYLRNGDQLTMAIPLEHRFPFLDVDVVEFGSRLPVAYLYRDGWSKFALRHAFRDVLPPAVTWRREKMGFPFPFARVLTAGAPTLQPLATRAARALFPGEHDLPYHDMVARDPLLLWRLCSVGWWLQEGA